MPDGTSSPLFDNIPEGLKRRKHFVLWRSEQRNGKTTKVPYQARSGDMAASTLPAHWCTFDEAVAAFEREPTKYSGIGFVFAEGDGLAGIDLDGCIDGDGLVAPRAQQIIDQLNSYCEVSPSGSGVKIFVQAKLPAGRRRRATAELGFKQIEMYDSGRYFTLTGRRLDGVSADIEPRQGEIEGLHSQVFASGKQPRSGEDQPRGADLTDDQVIETARIAPGYSQFRALFDRGLVPNGDHSEGDFVLCKLLASWVGPDPSRIDRLFRRSKLMRPKWDEARGSSTYGSNTIDSALRAKKDTKHPGRPPPAAVNVQDLIDRLLAGDAGSVFKHVADIASLDEAAYAELKTRLRIHFGRDLSIRDLERTVRAHRRAVRVAARARTPSLLPRIPVKGRPFRDITRDALSALNAANNPPQVFRRGTTLARVTADATGRPVVQFMTPSMTRGHMARAADFVKYEDGEVDVPIPPPEDVVLDLLALKDWPFPPLEGVVESPVLRADGSILLTPGYDPATRLLYVPDPGLVLPPMPEVPIPPDLFAAKHLIEELIEGFEFDGDASFVNAVAGLITPVVRPLHTGLAPAQIIDAPQKGSGKSLLAEVGAIIATGRSAQRMPAPAPLDDEEWRKRITAALVSGAPIINVDNVEGALRSPSLAMVLTAPDWHDRILGSTEMITLPHRATWVFTGNNIELGGDLPRRAYWTRLNPRTDRPWTRCDFRHPDLESWVRRERGRLLAALLTVARAWCLAGRPPAPDLPVFGGYNPWAQTVGGILAFAGFRGFLTNMDEMFERVDDEGTEWAGFVRFLRSAFGDQAFTAAALGDYLRKHAEYQPLVPEGLGESLGIKGSFERRIAKALNRKVQVRFGEEQVWLDNAGQNTTTCRLMWVVRQG